jgi:hypothetical protein
MVLIWAAADLCFPVAPCAVTRFPPAVCRVGGQLRASHSLSLERPLGVTARSLPVRRQAQRTTPSATSRSRRSSTFGDPFATQRSSRPGLAITAGRASPRSRQLYTYARNSRTNPALSQRGLSKRSRTAWLAADLSAHADKRVRGLAARDCFIAIAATTARRALSMRWGSDLAAGRTPPSA